MVAPVLIFDESDLHKRILADLSKLERFTHSFGHSGQEFWIHSALPIIKKPESEIQSIEFDPLVLNLQHVHLHLQLSRAGRATNNIKGFRSSHMDQCALLQLCKTKATKRHRVVRTEGETAMIRRSLGRVSTVAPSRCVVTVAYIWSCKGIFWTNKFKLCRLASHSPLSQGTRCC